MTIDPMPGALAFYRDADPRVLALGTIYSLDRRDLGLADARLRVLQDRLEALAQVPLHVRLAQMATEVEQLAAEEQNAQRLLFETEHR